MNKILLALAILGAGTAGFVTARQSTNRLQSEASAARESWVIQTQVLAAAQGERDELAERIRDLKRNLSQAEAADHQKDLWSVLETNRTGDLSPDVREHLREELGFNWNSSEDFIVVSKEAVRQMNMHAFSGERTWEFWEGKLTDSAAAVLALTPQERSQVEAALEHVKTGVKDWAISHSERSEPRGDVLAQYTLQGAPPASITNNLISEISSVVGPERMRLMEMGYWPTPCVGSIQGWISELGIGAGDKRVTIAVKRSSEGDQEVLKAYAGTEDEVARARGEKIAEYNFPTLFRPIFPNGWADVAKREGFELPKESQEK
jgi:hypothetical protein